MAFHASKIDILLMALEAKELGVESENIQQTATLSSHRKSCHRCGNVRKKTRTCSNCPHIFCRSCMVKMKTQHGKTSFSSASCPVCAAMCCCSNKSKNCSNKHHCYRKCPVSRELCTKNPYESKHEQLREESEDVSENTARLTQFTDLDSNASLDSGTASDKENNLKSFKYGSLFSIHPGIKAATSSLQTTSIFQQLPCQDEVSPL